MDHACKNSARDHLNKLILARGGAASAIVVDEYEAARLLLDKADAELQAARRDVENLIEFKANKEEK